MIVMAVVPLIWHKVIAAAVETKPAHLRLPRQEGACRGQTLKNLRIMMALHCYTTNSFVKKSGDGDAESLLFLMSFMPPVVSFVSIMSL
jgi:hypothetical protein